MEKKLQTTPNRSYRKRLLPTIIGQQTGQHRRNVLILKDKEDSAFTARLPFDRYVGLICSRGHEKSDVKLLQAHVQRQV